MAKQDIDAADSCCEGNKQVKNAANRKIALNLFLFVMPLLVLVYSQDILTKVLLGFYEIVLLYNFIRDKVSPDPVY